MFRNIILSLVLALLAGCVGDESVPNRIIDKVVLEQCSKASVSCSGGFIKYRHNRYISILRISDYCNHQCGPHAIDARNLMDIAREVEYIVFPDDLRWYYFAVLHAKQYVQKQS